MGHHVPPVGRCHLCWPAPGSGPTSPLPSHAHLSLAGSPPWHRWPCTGAGIGARQPVRQPQAGSGSGEPAAPGDLRREGNTCPSRPLGRGSEPRTPSFVPACSAPVLHPTCGRSGGLFLRLRIMQGDKLCCQKLLLDRYCIL